MQKVLVCHKKSTKIGLVRKQDRNVNIPLIIPTGRKKLPENPNRTILLLEITILT